MQYLIDVLYRSLTLTELEAEVLAERDTSVSAKHYLINEIDKMS
jgi:hypothetical protein